LNDANDLKRDRPDVARATAIAPQSLDVLAFRVGVDVVGYLDPAEAVAHIAVDAEDALHVHVPFDRRCDRAQLNVSVLGDRGDTRREATCQANKNVLDRRSTMIFGGK
jgi:hypothetical protein